MVTDSFNAPFVMPLPAACVTLIVLGEPDMPDVAAVTVTMADRDDVALLGAAVMLKLPGVLPLAEDTVSHDWFEAMV